MPGIGSIFALQHDQRLKFREYELLTREPLLRALAEAHLEIIRLRALVELHRAQAEGAFDMGRATRFGPSQEA